MSSKLKVALFWAWQLASVATFIKLTFFDDVNYNWWNWIIMIPLNLFLAEIWPIYWFVLRPFFGS